MPRRKRRRPRDEWTEDDSAEAQDEATTWLGWAVGMINLFTGRPVGEDPLNQFRKRRKKRGARTRTDHG